MILLLYKCEKYVHVLSLHCGVGRVLCGLVWGPQGMCCIRRETAVVRLVERGKVMITKGFNGKTVKVVDVGLGEPLFDDDRMSF
mgnify:CR=1 FL=1